MNKVYLVILLIICTECRERIYLGSEIAEKELNKALENPNEIDKQGKFLINEKVVAEGLTEIYVSSIYGKERIDRQRPFESHLIDHYWVTKGTLPYGTDGGTFYVIIDARSGEVIRLVHYR